MHFYVIILFQYALYSGVNLVILVMLKLFNEKTVVIVMYDSEYMILR
jgi:hypothetical protein